jgi:hypothetical protein
VTAALRVPPRLATWLLLNLGGGPFSESLAGDLMEEYQCGRSRCWYWREVAAGLFLARTRLLRRTAWSVADTLVAAFALIALGVGTLTWANVVKSDTAVPRHPASVSESRERP